MGADDVSRVTNIDMWSPTPKRSTVHEPRTTRIMNCKLPHGAQIEPHSTWKQNQYSGSFHAFPPPTRLSLVGWGIQYGSVTEPLWRGLRATPLLPMWNVLFDTESAHVSRCFCALFPIFHTICRRHEKKDTAKTAIKLIHHGEAGISSASTQ